MNAFVVLLGRRGPPTRRFRRLDGGWANRLLTHGWRRADEPRKRSREDE